MAATFKLIASHTVESGGTPSINFTSIPQTYTDLILKVSVRNNASATIRNSNLRVNNNSSSIYSEMIIDGIGTGTPSSSSTSGILLNWGGLANDTVSTANTFSNYEIYIPNYTSSANKTISVDAVAENNATFGQTRFSSLLASTSAPITSVNIIGEVDFLQYSTAYLYGVSNA